MDKFTFEYQFFIDGSGEMNNFFETDYPLANISKGDTFDIGMFLDTKDIKEKERTVKKIEHVINQRDRRHYIKLYIE